MRSSRLPTLLAMLVLLPWSPGALARDLLVPSAETPTVAVAVRQADAGDRVLIAPSYVPELVPVTVERSVTLMGSGGAAASPPLRVQGGAVLTLQDLVITGVPTAACPGLCADNAVVSLHQVTMQAAPITVSNGVLALIDTQLVGAELGVDASSSTVSLTRVLATGHGRAVQAVGSQVFVVASQFTGGRGETAGVDLWLSGGLLDASRVGFVGGSESAVVLNDTPALLTDVTISGYQAVQGALVHAQSDGLATLVMREVVADNLSADEGGLLFAQDVQVVLAEVDALGLNAQRGGAVALRGGSLNLSASTFADLLVEREGGVVDAEGSESVVVADVTLVGSAHDALAARGGLVSAAGGAVELRNSSLVDVVVSERGGGVSGWGTLRIDGLQSTRSVAEEGGVVAWEQGTAELQRLVSVGARAGRGGVVWADGLLSLSLGDSDFSGGLARDAGAGLYAANTDAVDIVRTHFCANRAGLGGAVAAELAAVQVHNSRFVANDARVGGALYAQGSTVDLTNNAVFADLSPGGALSVAWGEVALRNNAVVGGARGLALSDDASAVGGWNVWHANGSDNGRGAWRGDGDRVVAPSWEVGNVDEPCSASLVLSPSSPLRDSGDPELLDPDGSRSDVGAYGGPNALLADGDGDGYPQGVDCDDEDARVYPEATELPYDGTDQDCDGQDACDLDGDGYAAMECGGPDCDDTAASVHPGASDLPYNGRDEDCSGADLVDADGDGWVAIVAGGADCDDGDPSVHPGAEDRAGDGIDSNCDGGDTTSFLAGGAGCSILPSVPIGGWSVVLLLALGRRRS